MKINGEMHYLWRAGDHEDEVLESYVTKKRDKSCALRFLKKGLKRLGRANAIMASGLRSYSEAMRHIGNLDRREMGRGLNTGRKIAFAGPATRPQNFVSVHASMHNHFNCGRHRVGRQTYTFRRSAALAGREALMV